MKEAEPDIVCLCGTSLGGWDISLALKAYKVYRNDQGRGAALAVNFYFPSHILYIEALKQFGAFAIIKVRLKKNRSIDFFMGSLYFPSGVGYEAMAALNAIWTAPVPFDGGQS